MARRPDLEVFAKEHDIKIGTIADLIEYRNLNETTIEQVAKCKLPTVHGEFDLVTYKDTIDGQLHYVLLKGDIKDQEPTNVRVHLQSTFNDILLSDRSADRSWGLSEAMAYIAKNEGALVILGNSHIMYMVKAINITEYINVSPEIQTDSPIELIVLN